MSDTPSSPSITRPVSTTFECVHEWHRRSEFQAEGHFVPSNCTGPEVHALNLLSPRGVQILRVMAPTLAEATQLMTQAIYNHVYTAAMAAAQRSYTYEQFQALVTERGQLAMFLDQNYTYERAHSNRGQFSTPILTALYYLRIERTRLAIRLRDWLLRIRKPATVPSDGNQWLPKPNPKPPTESEPK